MTTSYTTQVPRRVLTVAETADVLRVSRWMVYRLIHTRRLKTIKLGSRRLVPTTEVDALLSSLDQESVR